MAAWQFSSTVAEERALALLQPTTFAAVRDAIAGDMDVLCCHRPNCDDQVGFSRVLFNLRVSPPAFDLFFNSPNGYRGAYFRSPYVGLEFNDTFIAHFTPSLLAWAEDHCPTLDCEFARESLSSPSAKVWLTEYENHLCPKCTGEWGNPNDELPEILNGRWELADSSNGRRGRKAPRLSKLRVFGAFLNERRDEFVPARKRHRAVQLHECGWS